jgi:RND family efflux transporter MFP subunit
MSTLTKPSGRSVKVITVGVSPLGTGLEFSGEVRARIDSRLGFRVGGKLLQRQAELGQVVKSGQLLAQLDPQDYQLAQDAARAQVAAAQTQRDLAAADLKRFQALRDQNFISSAEIERRDATLQAAQAQLDQAQAQLAAQGNQAAYTRLTAPAAGVVTAVEAEPGQVLAAGTPVLRLALDGPRDVVFAVPEDRVAAMRVGAAVRIKPWGQDAGWDKALAGQVPAYAAAAAGQHQAQAREGLLIPNGSAHHLLQASGAWLSSKVR